MDAMADASRASARRTSTWAMRVIEGRIVCPCRTLGAHPQSPRDPVETVRSQRVAFRDARVLEGACVLFHAQALHHGARAPVADGGERHHFFQAQLSTFSEPRAASVA